MGPYCTSLRNVHLEIVVMKLSDYKEIKGAKSWECAWRWPKGCVWWCCGVSLAGGLMWDVSPLLQESGGQVWEGQECHCSSEDCSHMVVTCPEGGPVAPWVCVPELPVWGQSFQTFINSLKRVGHWQGFGLLWCLPWGVTFAGVTGARQS